MSKSSETPLVELFSMDEDGSDSVASYDTLEEGLDDLIDRIRQTIEGTGFGWQDGAGNVCLTDVAAGYAYVNVITNIDPAAFDKTLELGKCRLTGNTQQDFDSLDPALREVNSLLGVAINERKTVFLDLHLAPGSSEVCEVIIETFQDGGNLTEEELWEQYQELLRNMKSKSANN